MCFIFLIILNYSKKEIAAVLINKINNYSIGERTKDYTKFYIHASSLSKSQKIENTYYEIEFDEGQGYVILYDADDIIFASRLQRVSNNNVFFHPHNTSSGFHNAFADAAEGMFFEGDKFKGGNLYDRIIAPGIIIPIVELSPDNTYNKRADLSYDITINKNDSINPPTPTPETGGGSGVVPTIGIIGPNPGEDVPTPRPRPTGAYQ